jgi:hypothetical protein
MVVVGLVFLGAMAWQDTHRAVKVETAAPKETPKVPFWSFIGVTSQGTKDKAQLVMETWGSKEKILWFGEGSYAASLGDVVQVQGKESIPRLEAVLASTSRLR